MKTIQLASKAFIIFSAICLSSVSMMAFFDPQSVMDLVQVKLTNTDAYSSVRGVYGGAGASIVIMLIYLLICHVRLALGFLSALWGFYALSRLITIFAEGPLGSFGSQWIKIETLLFIIAMSLFIAIKRKPINQSV